MILFRLAILSTIATCCFGSYLPVRRVRRHRLLSKQEKIIPDPQTTLTNLNSLETRISDWNATLAGNTTNVTTTATAVDTPYPVPSQVDDLGASIADIQNQSSQDMAQLVGTLSTNGMIVDGIRANLTRFADETRRNISRINSLIGDISDYSTSTLAGNAETIEAQLVNLQSQVDMLAGNNSASASIPHQLKEIGDSISSLERRVSTLESTDSVQTQVLASDSNSTVDNTGLDFVLYSWTGRIALGGAICAIVAVILASVALSKCPSAPVAPEEPKQGEQVLLETGADQEAQEGEPQEYDPNDPNAQYYAQQGEAEQQQ